MFDATVHAVVVDTVYVPTEKGLHGLRPWLDQGGSGPVLPFVSAFVAKFQESER